MTTPIQILELMDSKAASDLTNAIKMFEEMLHDVAPIATEPTTILLFNNSCGFKDDLKSVLGIKQNDNQFEQIEHSGSNSG